MNTRAMLLALLTALFSSAACAAEPHVTVLMGGTVIDVSHRGHSRHDIADAAVVLDGTRITAVAPRAGFVPPPGAKIVDVSGKFIVPGLVDGFSGMQNQAEANAELYEGVTTIVASGDNRRGMLYLAADPSPHVYPMDSAGSTDDWSLLRNDAAWRDRLADGDAPPHELPPDETRAQVAETARRGTRVVWIGHDITASNAEAIIAQARALHLVTYGEFIATPYRNGMDAGVSSLLHMNRLELGLAPPNLIAAIAAAMADPEGKVGAAVQKAYDAIDAIDPSDLSVGRYGDLLASRNVAIMPTFSIYYAELPGHRNVWLDPVAATLDPKTLYRPPDPKTGDMSYPDEAARTRRLTSVLHTFAIAKVLIAHHAPVLAASGASAFGALPGIGMHTELETLVRAGLTAREALAAATGNYAELFGWTELGAIAPGRRADLLILKSDPTRDVKNAGDIDSVYLAGERLDREKLIARPRS